MSEYTTVPTKKKEVVKFLQNFLLKNGDNKDFSSYKRETHYVKKGTTKVPKEKEKQKIFKLCLFFTLKETYQRRTLNDSKYLDKLHKVVYTF